jgi:putative methionine-R-sulfoxide reductase with GAF domain
MLVYSQSLLDAFPAGRLLTDADRAVRQVNRWLRVRLGAAAANAMIGVPLHLAIPDLDERGLLPAYDLVRHRLTNVSLSASTYRYFIQLPAAAEIGLSEMPQGTTLVPLVVDGDFAGTLTIIEDLTDRRIAELQLQREIDKLTALHAIDHALATLDLPACLQIIVDRTRALFQAENVALLLLQGDQLVVAADAGYPQSYVGDAIPATAGVSGWTVAHQRSVLVPDVRVDTRFIQKDPRVLSEMTTPLLLRGECLGALNVESRRLNAFGEADVDLLETLGARAAVAIHNARLHTAEHEQRVLADTLRDITLTLSS